MKKQKEFIVEIDNKEFTVLVSAEIADNYVENVKVIRVEDAHGDFAPAYLYDEIVERVTDDAHEDYWT